MSKIVEVYGRKTGKTTRTSYVEALTRQENETLAIALHFCKIKMSEPYNVTVKTTRKSTKGE